MGPQIAETQLCEKFPFSASVDVRRFGSNQELWLLANPNGPCCKFKDSANICIMAQYH